MNDDPDPFYSDIEYNHLPENFWHGLYRLRKRREEAECCCNCHQAAQQVIPLHPLLQKALDLMVWGLIVFGAVFVLMMTVLIS